MRKFIIFLFFIPALASLGHDIYIFQQNQDKGFQLTDLGALWDKYDKKSHDQWKDKVRQISETVADLTPEQLSILTEAKEVSTPAPEENPPAFTEGFTQMDEKDKETVTMAVKKDDVVETQANIAQSWIGFVLEQKAVFVFGLLAVFVFLLSTILGWIFKEKDGMDELDKIQKKKKKDGNYSYSRK